MPIFVETYDLSRLTRYFLGLTDYMLESLDFRQKPHEGAFFKGRFWGDAGTLGHPI